MLASKLLGWTTIGYVEWNEYCQQVIAQRIEDGILDTAPIFTDVREFVLSGAAKQYRGFVDVLTAGFPCQPFSLGGLQKGEADPRNMWPSTRDAIDAVRPRYCYLENVSGLLVHRYIHRIFADLAALGLDARWGVLGGHDTGAICDGKRIWIVAAAPDRQLRQSMVVQKPVLTGQEGSFRRGYSRAIGAMLSQDDYTALKRDPDAVACGMERLKAIGNGQDPIVAATAWQLLTNGRPNHAAP
ncbi:MAG: DNA cytosine methyltransferase [Alphaproteobacteria bacterium]